MINKVVASAARAVTDIQDGATVMIGGFGTAGMPSELIDALIAKGSKELTIVNNNAGNGDTGLAALLKARQVKKIICSFPRQTDSWVFDGLYKKGDIELELINDDKNTHCALLPSNGDSQFIWLVNQSRGTATLNLDGPGYY